MPVRVEIHASLVSKKVARSSLLTVSEGNALPVPITFMFVIQIKIRCKSISVGAHKKKKVAVVGKMWRKSPFWDEIPRF